jgi:hypothetical protein
MKTNWKMLREQKQTLLNVIEAADEDDQEHLTGILHLIDSIQDSAAGNPSIGAEIVFGPPVPTNPRAANGCDGTAESRMGSDLVQPR